MKGIIVAFLGFLLLLPNFGNMIVYFSFKLNQEEISRTICVQRNFVYNTCNGRCVLEKSIKKLEQNQKNAESNLKEKFDLQFTLQEVVWPENVTVVASVFPKIPSLYATGKAKKAIVPVFRPPSFIS